MQKKIINFIIILILIIQFGAIIFLYNKFNSQIKENNNLHNEIENITEDLKSKTEKLEELEANNNNIDLDDCIKNSNPNNYPFCLMDEQEKYKKEIDTNLNLLKNSMSKEQYNIILESQNIWNKSISQDTKMIYRYIKANGGTFDETLALNEILALYATRASLLKSLYFYYSEKKKEFDPDIDI